MSEGKPERLVSLDAFRGITMFLLVAEGARVYAKAWYLPIEGAWFAAFIKQFHHEPWQGLRFWDLVQPFFMFIVGVAMPYSIGGRIKRGDSWGLLTRHMVRRCAILLALGVGLHCWYARALVWELWNVLSQLAFTILVAFAIYRWSAKRQLIFSFALIALTDVLYRTFWVEGFDQPFVKGHNFGSWVDLLIMGKTNGGGWVAINAVPTAAHTIWGVLAGKLLLHTPDAKKRLQVLIGAGAVGVVIGLGLHFSGLEPSIKRICTSAFVLASGGFCLLVLALLYWIVDLRGYQRWTRFAVIVGMNPIFIYVFYQLAKGWFNGAFEWAIATPLAWIGMPETVAVFVSALGALGGYWLLCYVLYRRRIFIRI